MATAHEFGRNELLTDLRRHGPKQVQDYYGDHGWLRGLVRGCADGCTFRAYHRLKEKPSRIFRAWARAYLIERLDDLRAVETQADFDAFLSETFDSLATAWLDRGGKRLRYGKGMKLIDLLFKSALRWRRFSDTERDRLVKLLHVPLDKYSLAAIRWVATTGEFGPVVRIPRNASMGFVKGRRLYDELQQIMRAVATKAGVPTICFDLIAWNLAHA